MQAVILAAGDGGRIGHQIKALLKVNETTLVTRLCSTFEAVGPTLVVVGYGASAVVRELRPFIDTGKVRIVLNDKWETTDNAYSLALALDERMDDSFVINVDTVFDSGLVRDRVWLPNTIAVKYKETTAEDMQVKVAGGRIVQLAKDIDGEAEALVYCFSQRLLRHCHAELKENDGKHFENIINLHNDGSLVPMDIYPFRATEIDTAADYAEALALFEGGEE